MTERILFVDDETNVLEGIRRSLRSGYQPLFAGSPTRALEMLRKHPDIAVVVSDLRMPEANGADLLAAVRQLRPDVIRLVLSGQADMDLAMAAVNRGQIFRYLSKPCSREILSGALDAALEEFRRARAEQDLLEQTLAAAIGVLAETLAMANPLAFSRTARILTLVESVAGEVELGVTWELRVAAMLSQIGCLSLPPTLLRKVAAGQTLEPGEQESFDRHPDVAASLINRIPRMEGVAELVRRQAPSATTPADDPHRQLAAEVIRAASEYERSVTQGLDHAVIYERLATLDPPLSAAVLHAAGRLRFREARTEVRSVSIDHLTHTMVFEEDVMSRGGMLLVSKGQPATETVLLHLLNFAHGVGIVEPVVVRVPIDRGLAVTDLIAIAQNKQEQ